MFDKITGKENITKVITIMLIVSIVILALSIFSETDDGRKQIIDMDGGTETRLCNALSSIEGVGEVEVMIQTDSNDEVAGVIVIAEGGSNPVIANKLTQGVSTLYNIPVSNVIVFEKEMEE